MSKLKQMLGPFQCDRLPCTISDMISGYMDQIWTVHGMCYMDATYVHSWNVSTINDLIEHVFPARYL